MYTKVENVLSLLPPKYTFGKFFLENRLVSSLLVPKIITLNYKNDYDFGAAVGFLAGKGFEGVMNEKNELTLVFSNSTLKLNKKVPVLVTDFDFLDYNWKYQYFVYDGQTLSDVLRNKFLDCNCTLTFNPKNAATQEKRQALFRYIRTSWTIFDEQEI
jgi:hypothetical protein